MGLGTIEDPAHAHHVAYFFVFRHTPPLVVEADDE